MAALRHTIPGLPVERLHEIRDNLVLALDATERRAGYARQEREARSYLRAALRHAEALLTGGRHV